MVEFKFDERSIMKKDQIAAIGATTRLRELPNLLDDDQWNNIEPALFEFARLISEVEREKCAEICDRRAKLILGTMEQKYEAMECAKAIRGRRGEK